MNTASHEPGTALALYVDTIGRPTAREAGRIIERLANAFDQHARVGRAELHLRIGALEVHSLFATLVAAGDLASNIYDHHGALGALAERAFELRGVVMSFFKELQDGISIILRNGQSVTPSIRDAIDALARPIYRKTARSTEIRIVGDNNSVIIINAGDAAAIWEWMGKNAPSRQGGGGGFSGTPRSGPAFEEAISEFGIPKWVSARDSVGFEAMIDGRRVEFLVTNEALEDIVGAHGHLDPDEAMQAFEVARGEIHAVAERVFRFRKSQTQPILLTSLEFGY